MGLGQFRGIVTIVTFLAIILIVLGAAAVQTPTFLATPAPDAPDASDKTNPQNFLAWNQTNAFYLNVTNPLNETEIPGWHWIISYKASYGDAKGGINIYTFDHWGILHINQEDLRWYNESTGHRLSSVFSLGTEVMYLQTIEDAYSASNPYGEINYRLTNSRGSIHIYLTWDVVSYGGNLTAAYVGTGIWFTIKQNFNDRQTTLNLMDLLSGLFLGSLFGSNTLNIDPIMSAIITIALDSAMVYLVYSIVTVLFFGGGD